jgi:nitrite reductase/ring-hydroxylating ferredoxin subunit
MVWHRVADLSDFADKGVIGRECVGHAVAIYKVGNAYYASSNICTHANGVLSEGEIVDRMSAPLRAI